MSRSEVPCVVQGPSLDEEIHFVIHKKQAKQLLKQKHVFNKAVYIKFGHSEMRCTVADVKEFKPREWDAR